MGWVHIFKPLWDGFLNVIGMGLGAVTVVYFVIRAEIFHDRRRGPRP